MALALLSAGVGCRSSCGERKGLFGFGLCHSSNQHTDGTLAGLGKAGGGDCYGGEAVPGQLMSFPARPAFLPRPDPAWSPATRTNCRCLSRANSSRANGCRSRPSRSGPRAGRVVLLDEGEVTLCSASRPA